MSGRGQAGRFGLAGYYVLEGFNSFGTNVFFLGVFFHARISHGFSTTDNLLLAAAQGAAYVSATRARGRFADRAGVARSIGLGLSGMCLALVAGWLSRPGWVLFPAITLYSASTALTWPALEAAVARAPGQIPLARRTGLYNLVWSLVGAAGFFLSGPLFALDPDTVFWAPLAAHGLQLAGLALAAALFTPSPTSARGCSHGGAAPFGAADAAVTPGRHTARTVQGGANANGEPQRPPQRRGGRQDPGACMGTTASSARLMSPEAHAGFLKSAWFANGLGYFFFGAFTASAPTLGERFGLDPRLAIWLVSVYLFARSGAFALFWLWDGWEYRRGWLAAALALPPAVFAIIFTARSAAAAIAALAFLGALSGLAYSFSLHASLDRDGGEAEGGGLHEWVIGLGVLFGPLAGAAGVRLIGGLNGAGVVVSVIGAAVALAGLRLLKRGHLRQ